MRMSLCAAIFCAASSAALAADRPLLDIYKGIHSHPELSHFETQTSALLADEMRKAGYEVTDHIGVYPDGSKAYGVIGIMKNGRGPTLLIRADMDALPIVEETGVSYASHVTARNAAGQEVGVMHACGHDVHTTVLVGTARALADAKSKWHGTLMLVGQPSEETGDGAKAMLTDKLYERFGKPDMVIGLHDTSARAAGTVEIHPGATMASSTSIDVTIKGIGGHGARPQAGRDPVVLAALFITQLQTIVSREEDPQAPTVVTVGHIVGGTKRNIIPDEVKLELTTRSFSDESRQVVIDGIRQMAQGIAVSAGLPPDKAPIVAVTDESTPFLYNDPAQTARVKAALVAELGEARVFDQKPMMPSEDVGRFGLEDRKIPVTYFGLGTINPKEFAAAEAEHREMPGWHTSKFKPDPEPTLETGVRAMTAAAIALMAGK